MKHFYFLLISLFIVGCSNDMNDSEQSTDMNVSEQETERFFSQENALNVLSDEETTLREKLALLTNDYELWFNETEYNKQLEENNQEAYHFERFFQSDSISEIRYFKLYDNQCWTDFYNSDIGIDKIEFSDSPFRVGLIPVDADGGSQELSLEEGVLYHRVVCTCPNEDFTGPAKWDIAVYKLITNEQFQLMNDWMPSLLPCNIPDAG